MTTTVITGGNRGIGLELCRLAAGRGDQVIALCRRSSSDLEALNVRIEDDIDVGSDEVMQTLASRLNDVSVDILINCAGILSRQSLHDLDLDAIRRQFEVNSLGPLRITAALRPHLKPGSKVAIITSRMGSIADNTSGSYYGYRMSKAAVNMVGVSLAHDLRDNEISVILLHPGYVKTDMTGHSGNVDPRDSAHGLLAQINELTLESSGSFHHMDGQSLPW